MAKRSAPLMDLNCPDTLTFTFIFLMALSETLLSGGNFGTVQKGKYGLSVFDHAFDKCLYLFVAVDTIGL
jgi:hypothetical protein